MGDSVLDVTAAAKCLKRGVDRNCAGRHSLGLLGAQATCHVGLFLEGFLEKVSLLGTSG